MSQAETPPAELETILPLTWWDSLKLLDLITATAVVGIDFEDCMGFGEHSRSFAGMLARQLPEQTIELNCRRRANVESPVISRNVWLLSSALQSA